MNSTLQEAWWIKANSNVVDKKCQLSGQWEVHKVRFPLWDQRAQTSLLSFLLQCFIRHKTQQRISVSGVLTALRSSQRTFRACKAEDGEQLISSPFWCETSGQLRLSALLSSFWIKLGTIENLKNRVEILLWPVFWWNKASIFMWIPCY